MYTKLGNWLFRFRNILFPLLYIALFIPSPVLLQNDKVTLAVGLIIITTGFIIRSATIGLTYIIRGGAKRRIYAGTLVTEGIYKICRNPMYLGNILLLAGFGILANSVLFMLVFAPLFILFYAAIIHAEENFLLNKFGNQYIEYKRNSNSIIPDLRNLKKAFKGHAFNWKKVIYKEYNSLFLYFSGIFLLLLWRYHLDVVIFAISELILVVLYITVKILKKRKRMSQH